MSESEPVTETVEEVEEVVEPIAGIGTLVFRQVGRIRQ